MHRIGEDRSERLDIVPAQLRVIVTVRPKYACRACTDGVTQAPTPPWLIERGFGPRGQATALFALLVTEQLAPELGEFVLNLAINTVSISALLHGVTAVPLAKAFAARTIRREPSER